MFKRFLNQVAKVHQDYLKCSPINQELCYQQSYKDMTQLVSNLKASDFNVGKHTFKQLNGYSQIELWEEPKHNTSFGIFILPKGMIVPLHDHPGMWVITKILHGKAIRNTFVLNKEYRNLQWTYPNLVNIQKDQQAIKNLPLVTATKTGSNIVKEGMLDFVKPIYNNLHEFVADEDDFIFFNCFIPHYDNEKRFTNYYKYLDLKGDQQNLQMLTKATDHYNHKKTYIPKDENCKFLQPETEEEEQQYLRDSSEQQYKNSQQVI